MTPIIVWFRRDLRLADNPALGFAARTGRPLVCLYVLDDETAGAWKWGGAARWWLHHSLTALDKSLNRHGGKLVLRRGPVDQILPAVIRECGADMLAWNRCYEPHAVARDTALKTSLTKTGVAVESFHGALLFEPWEITSREGRPFRVFTPFWRALNEKTAPGRPDPAPPRLHFHQGLASEALDDWALLPGKPDWARHFPWNPGEAAAQRALTDFLNRIGAYDRTRDRPGTDGTSRLSPHLSWGEISPRQVWHAAKAQVPGSGVQTFLKELGWREFCAQLLFHNPTLPEQPFDRRFENFPWRHSDPDFHAWCRGQTGYPIVDAGMRQLWQTGWMHNRVRMIAASLLVKHLGIHWTQGERWFWDTLVDADLANNAANWQWVAGSGADAAPFFRIFNPVLQGEKFDSSGDYVRSFVPELRQLPDAFIHKPWKAPRPPPNYPLPIVELNAGRKRALKAFKALAKG
jgi:deoxyribodipyrimidine photo-lyase